MRVVFMGTPEFAVPSLEALAGATGLVAVYTRPDAASGRGGRLRPSPVKVAAEKLALPILQPSSLREPSAVAELREFSPDLIVVAAYGLILPADVLALPALGCINVHASLLPRWRGAAPIQRAILAGDAVTGVSIMAMEEGLDTGPFCATRTVPLADKTAAQLTVELAKAGADALLGVLPLIEAGACAWVEQDEALATYASKIEKADTLLSPERTASELARRVRASTPQAPARALVAGRAVTVVDAAAVPAAVGRGRVASADSALLLGASEGTLSVTRIKPDGKPEMPAADWVRGLRLSGDETWEALS